MKQYDVGWSEQRRRSSRVLAYYIESSGGKWTSIREAVLKIAPDLGISPEKKRRSAIAIECMAALEANGTVPPVGYVPPWIRNGDLPILRSPKRGKPTTDAKIAAFYDSFEWKRARFAILASRGRRCECCGADSKTAIIHVDHIKPLRKRWDLRLEPDNLQVLCEACNAGKGSKFHTDFRGA